MKKYAIAFVTFLVAFLPALDGKCTEPRTAKLVQTISLPGVQGRVDHIAVDDTGTGLVAVCSQNGANDYATRVKIASETDTQPLLWAPQFGRLYFPVAAQTPWNDRATTLDQYSQSVYADKFEAREDIALANTSTSALD